MSAKQKPQLMSYLSISHYLEDLYKFRKETEQNFTYESWAQELGIKNRAFLSQLVSGRRKFTEATIQLFVDKMALTKSEQEYFHLLVLYSMARAQVQRDAYGRKLRQLMNQSYPQTQVEPAKNLVASTLYPRILAFLTFKDVTKTAENIRRIFNISMEQANESLQTIKALGLIELDGETWITTRTAYKVPEKIGDADLMNYHHKSLLDAIEARKSPVHERRFRSLILALNENEFLKITEEMNAFLTEMLGKFDVDYFHDRKIYQLNFNLHVASSQAEDHAPENSISN